MPPDRVRVLFWVSFLPILAFVLQVFSSDWVPKLYQLKFKCLNAQLHKQQTSLTAELYSLVRVLGKPFHLFFNEGLYAAIK